MKLFSFHQLSYTTIVRHCFPRKISVGPASSSLWEVAPGRESKATKGPEKIKESLDQETTRLHAWRWIVARLNTGLRLIFLFEGFHIDRIAIVDKFADELIDLIQCQFSPAHEKALKEAAFSDGQFKYW